MANAKIEAWERAKGVVVSVAAWQDADKVDRLAKAGDALAAEVARLEGEVARRDVVISEMRGMVAEMRETDAVQHALLTGLSQFQDGFAAREAGKARPDVAEDGFLDGWDSAEATIAEARKAALLEAAEKIEPLGEGDRHPDREEYDLGYRNGIRTAVSRLRNPDSMDETWRSASSRESATQAQKTRQTEV